MFMTGEVGSYRQLVLPKPIKGWTLTTLREKLIKIGAKVVAHPGWKNRCLGLFPVVA